MVGPSVRRRGWAVWEVVLAVAVACGIGGVMCGVGGCIGAMAFRVEAGIWDGWRLGPEQEWAMGAMGCEGFGCAGRRDVVGNWA